MLWFVSLHYNINLLNVHDSLRKRIENDALPKGSEIIRNHGGTVATTTQTNISHISLVDLVEIFSSNGFK